MSSADEIDLVGAYRQYSKSVQRKIEAAAKRLGREMLEEIQEQTPIGNHTYRGLKRRKRKTERLIPGQLKADWKIRNVSDGDGVHVTAYASKSSSGLVHLLDLGHRMPRGGEYRGSGFVTEIQKKYREKLYAEIERILSET